MSSSVYKRSIIYKRSNPQAGCSTRFISICLCSILIFAMTSLTLIPMHVNAEAEPLTIAITAPSTNQKCIASGRDFYVIGTLSGSVPIDMLLEVSLTRCADWNDGGTPVPLQCVSAHEKNSTSLFTDYTGLSYYGGDDRSPLLNSLMPDLVYDKNNVDSFKDVWRKCTYSDSAFAAAFSGGVYSDGVRLINKDNSPITPLENGSYRITVSAHDSFGRLLDENYTDITIGSNSNKMLGRFSPSVHFNKLKKFGEENGYSVYTDPFPGYWSPSSYIAGLENSDLFCEILPKWRCADAMEYSSGLTHAILYNISPTSASNSVELGSLQNQGVIDDPTRVRFYHYDIGEPQMVVGSQTLEGNLVPMKDGDKLDLIRADYSKTSDEADNRLDTSSLSSLQSDINISDGVAATAGETISLYGVTAPIQNSTSDISAKNDYSFTVNNHIAKVHYNIVGDGVNTTIDKEVGVLTRVADSKESSILYEFKHVLKIDDSWNGKDLAVNISADDVNGNPIAGASDKFFLCVGTNTVIDPAATPSIGAEPSPTPKAEQPILKSIKFSKKTYTIKKNKIIKIALKKTYRSPTLSWQHDLSLAGFNRGSASSMQLSKIVQPAWQIKNAKIAKFVVSKKLKAKTNGNSVRVKGLRKGKTQIIARLQAKKATCKIAVK